MRNCSELRVRVGESFFPASRAGWQDKGPQSIERLTAVGHVRIRRRVWWRKGAGTRIPGDGWLDGEQAAEAAARREQALEAAVHEGPDEVLDEITRQRNQTRARTRLERRLRAYVGERVTMMDYPTCRARGWDISSGPTEAQCKTMTVRLKGPGMRWAPSNADAMLALTGLADSDEWPAYWHNQDALWNQSHPRWSAWQLRRRFGARCPRGRAVGRRRMIRVRRALSASEGCRRQSVALAGASASDGCQNDHARGKTA